MLVKRASRARFGSQIEMKLLVMATYLAKFVVRDSLIHRIIKIKTKGAFK